MELSPKLESLSKVLKQLSEEVQRLETEKIHYEYLEKNMKNMDWNLKIVFAMICSLYIIILSMKFWSWLKKRRNRGRNSENLQRNRRQTIVDDRSPCIETRSPRTPTIRYSKNLAPVVLSIKQP